MTSESYILETKITSEILIKFLDNYVQKIDKLTVVVIDNAPIHTSKAIGKKIAEWRQKKLEIFWLPTYSPQLNFSRSQTYWFRLQGSREQRAEEKIRIRKWDLK